MSRCFPFPPPGYVGSKANNDVALIESIKLQRESEKAKAERKKERKREKKEKRERKEKDKAKQYLDGSGDPKAHKIAPDGEAHRSLGDSKGAFKEKMRAEIVEQMEKSGLTEEHKQPVGLHKPSYSSDSTENSNKRTRHASPAPSPNGGITGHGNVIRIRLPLGKNHKKPKLDEENICSTSGRTELAVPLQKDPTIGKQKTIEVKRPICSTLGADKLFAPVDIPKPSVLAPFEKKNHAPVDVPKPSILTPFEKKVQAASFLYKELVDKLPSAIPSEYMDLDDDQEWLFSRKQQNNRQVVISDKPSGDLSCRGSSLLQPRAYLLPDVGIYALPYTLPF